MQSLALIPWLDPAAIIGWAGPWALLVVCFIVFAETGLLIGFLLPGDTLLVISGLLSHPTEQFPNGVFGVSVWVVALSIAFAAFIGGEVGYLIGYKGGPAVFGTLAVTLWHYFRERAKARKEAASGADVVTDEAEARQLVLDPEVFKRGPEHGHKTDEAPPTP